MKKFFLYMTAALMMAACSSEGDVLTPTVEDKDMVPEEPLTGVRASVPDVLMYGDEDLTRTSLTYSLAEKRMKFTWETGDNIGVFPTTRKGSNEEVIDTDEADEIQFALTSDPLVVGANSVTGTFEPSDNSIQALEGNTKYISYSPFVSYQGNGEFGYTAVPVSYEGQVQAQNVNIKAYATDTSSDAYKTSEAAASKHLGAYDFLVSEEITTTENGGAHFNYTRMGGVVRFFFKVPNAEVVDELQLVNPTANFMLAGTMNVKTKTFNPTKTGHMQTLRFASHPSFDMTSSTNNPSYRNETQAYIICYMMAAPIVLTSSSIAPCTLYLVCHKSSTDPTKSYYKATLNKYDIPQDRVLQWTPSNNPDDPITFTPITVQEWEAGKIFTNGDGNGTGGF